VQTLVTSVAAPSWDETSRYGSVEASRAAAAALLAPFASSSWDDTSGYGSVEASRAANALQAQPGAVTTQVPADVRWAPARALVTGAAPLSSPDAVPTALAWRTRAESALLWSILHQESAVKANSDDRIANALFGEQSFADTP
jgi:hypothetical protein